MTMLTDICPTLTPVDVQKAWEIFIVYVVVLVWNVVLNFVVVWMLMKDPSPIAGQCGHRSLA